MAIMSTGEGFQVILEFIKSSWDNALSDETKKVFIVMANLGKAVQINTLTFKVEIDRNKITSNLAALEALQLVSFDRKGVAKSYEITQIGSAFFNFLDSKDKEV